MRIVAALFFAFVLAADAAAGQVQSLAFRFADNGAAAYRYVSGDLPFEATAQLSGQLVLQYDAATGDAQISLVQGILHSPQKVLGDFGGDAAWLAGADLEAEVPGVYDGMRGLRTGPLTFAFGPGITADGHYRTEFLLSIAPSDPRLSGEAEFNGFDGSTMYLNAPLIAVPEPATASVALMLGATTLLRARGLPARQVAVD